jgi:hypothetical protein
LNTEAVGADVPTQMMLSRFAVAGPEGVVVQGVEIDNMMMDIECATEAVL